jgi:hypothetical protein
MVGQTISLLVDTSKGMGYPASDCWSKSRIQQRGVWGLFGGNIDQYTNFLATNPEKVWEIEIKGSPMYEQDDGELTAQQINAIRHASSATNTPEENFGDSLFTRED